MGTRFWVSQAAVATICLAPLTNRQADAIPPVAHVYETQEGSNTEYSVGNNRRSL
jgi:hypothetical protein